MATSTTSGSASGSSGLRRLVIVESPAKAKTIEGYLGPGYDVEASRRSHPRPAQPSAAEIPAEVQEGAARPARGRRRPRLRADLRRRRRQEAEGRRAEGEARRTPTSSTRDGRGPRGRGDRLAPAARCSSPRCRSAGWSSTRSPATRSSAAVEDTRELDQTLVDAQETRRILDRLYGYEVSPGAVAEGRAGPVGRPRAVGGDPAGRRARARAHRVPPASLLGRRGPFARPGRRSRRGSSRVDGRAGRDRPRLRPRRRSCKAADVAVLDEAAARSLADGARAARRSPCASVEDKPYRRSPAAPFMTSTLQQEASRKLRLSRAGARCASRSGSTRTATSPTCAPTPRRCRSRRVDAARDAGRASCTAPTTCRTRRGRYDAQGEERAGGARGDPPGRRRVPHAGRGRRRAAPATSSRSTT